jgi:hypothetical protein
VLVQVRARQEVGQHVVFAAAVAGVEIDVLCCGDGIDFSQEAG